MQQHRSRPCVVGRQGQLDRISRYFGNVLVERAHEVCLRDHGITDRVRVRCSVTIVVLAPGSPGTRHELRRSHRAGR